MVTYTLPLSYRMAPIFATLGKIIIGLIWKHGKKPMIKHGTAISGNLIQRYLDWTKRLHEKRKTGIDKDTHS